MYDISDDQLNKALNIIIKEIEPEKIILFGSRANNRHSNDSDYDFCIIKKAVKQKRQLTQKIYKKLYGLGIIIDIIIETPEKYEELKNNPYLVYNEIEKYGRLLYTK